MSLQSKARNEIPDHGLLTVSVDKAMEMTGLGRVCIFGLMRDGKIKRIKVGRRTLINYHSLVEYLKNGDPDWREKRT